MYTCIRHRQLHGKPFWLANRKCKENLRVPRECVKNFSHIHSEHGYALVNCTRQGKELKSVVKTKDYCTSSTSAPLLNAVINSTSIIRWLNLNKRLKIILPTNSADTRLRNSCLSAVRARDNFYTYAYLFRSRDPQSARMSA